MTSKWWSGAALAFDTETTGPDPRTARCVTAHAGVIGNKGAGEVTSWLVNPQMEIPAEATAIHGITNEQAATGRHPQEALREIVATIATYWRTHLPLIAFNANYDLTMLWAECERWHIPTPQIGSIIDPFVIDRMVDKYRRGSRKLPDMAKHYGCKQDGAHTAAGDALAAARIVWKMKEKGILASLSLEDLQDWQRKAHADRQEDYRKYLRREGKPQEQIDEVDGGWPLRTGTPIGASAEAP